MTSSAWNNLVQKNAPPFGGFLQSWQWGDFQEKLGFSVKRIFEQNADGTLIAQCLRQPLPLGRHYWFIPKGPLGSMPLDAAIPLLTSKLPGDFLKIEPARFDAGDACYASLRRVPERHPAHTSILSLDKPSPDLLLAMKEKTRYNIRLAQKKGVTVRRGSLADINAFLDLMRQTGDRDGFHLHAPDRYRGLLEHLTTADCHAFLVLAEHQGSPLAANIMIDAFGTRTYLHGASSNAARNLMAPYALHAFLIEDACANGLTAYDFWGTAPPEADEHHPWAGLSRFKAGFGGTPVSMLGTFDLVQSRLGYALYHGAKALKKRLS